MSLSRTGRRSEANFFVLLLLALLLFHLPGWLSAPFKWFEVFFHELSHGLMAVATGGSIERIDLQYGGSGTCYYRGGWRPLVAFAGYAGASLWGWMLYETGRTLRHTTAGLLVTLLLITLLLSALLWVRDLQTLLILGLMSALLLLLLRLGDNALLKGFVQFTGLFVLLASIQSPLFLLDGAARGDGATLQRLTLLPEVVWIVVWCGLGLLILWLLFRQALRS